MKLPEKISNSRAYQIMTRDITMKDIVGEERYERMKENKIYEFVSDWAGMATNKLVLGIYMDMRVGMSLTTSLIARGISLGVHSATSPFYTKVRNFVYEKGNIDETRSVPVRYATDLLAFNLVQTPLYFTQVGVALVVKAALDSNVELGHEDLDTVGRAALAFYTNSWWLGPAGKWTMDNCRRFFGSKIPEQLVSTSKSNRLEEIVAN